MTTAFVSHRTCNVCEAMCGMLMRVEEDEARDDGLPLEAIEHRLELGLEQLGHSREQVQLVTREHGVLEPGP